MKSFESASGLDYSCVVGGTSIKLLCVCFLFFYLFICVFCTLSAAIQLCVRRGTPQIVTKFSSHRKRNHNKPTQFNPPSCVFLTISVEAWEGLVSRAKHQSSSSRSWVENAILDKTEGTKLRTKFDC